MTKMKTAAKTAAYLTLGGLLLGAEKLEENSVPARHREIVGENYVTMVHRHGTSGHVVEYGFDDDGKISWEGDRDIDRIEVVGMRGGPRGSGPAPIRYAHIRDSGDMSLFRSHDQQLAARK